MDQNPKRIAREELPPIPAKRYFTIGEVSDLCGVKPHVLRYWEQEFSQLKPVKRRGNRRYYQHHEVLLVRRIRELLYGQGFTISGARNRLMSDGLPDFPEGVEKTAAAVSTEKGSAVVGAQPTETPVKAAAPMTAAYLRAELKNIISLLSV
ncbi:MAG: MerR family transcriptional regulator [Betaproteobacteria bacterium]|nr:MerR family transcriptional regulator [Betaproteobacteria bacterium]